MSKICILIMMIFCHIIDDYVLQGKLADLKQREWWKVNAPKKKYKNDYKVALLCHGLEWSTMIMLPIMVQQNFNVGINFLIVWAAMGMIHAWIDDIKANHLDFNLIEDQSFHFIQIALVFGWYYVSLSTFGTF